MLYFVIALIIKRIRSHPFRISNTCIKYGVFTRNGYNCHVMVLYDTFFQRTYGHNTVTKKKRSSVNESMNLK